MLREGEEYLSVNWLEELKSPSRASQIRDLQELYTKKLKVAATARIAILNVGTLRTKVERESPDSRLLRVLHEQEELDDPSHAGIYEIRHDDEISRGADRPGSPRKSSGPSLMTSDYVHSNFGWSGTAIIQCTNVTNTPVLSINFSLPAATHSTTLHARQPKSNLDRGKSILRSGRI